MTILTQEFVFTALELEKSGNQFPIDFDDIYLELGYTRKDNAVRALLSMDFEESRDILKNEGINKNQNNKFLPVVMV